MKLDKESIILLSICMIALMLSPFIFPPSPKKAPPKTAETVEPPQAEEPAKSTKKAKEAKEELPTSKPKAPKEKAPLKKVSLKKLPDQIISNDDISVKIDPNAGAVTWVELKKFLNSDKKSNVELDKGLSPGALSVKSETPWELLDIKVESPSPESLSVTRKFQKGDARFTLRQIWKLTKGYTTDYKVIIENNGSKPATFKGFRVNAGGMPPLKLLTGDKTYRDIHCIGSYIANEKHLEDTYTSATKEEDKNFKDIKKPLKWIVVSNKYFACILLPEKEKFEEGNEVYRKIITRKEKVKEFILKRLLKIAFGGGGSEHKQDVKYALLSAAGVYKDFTVEPGKAKDFSLRYYTGPKQISHLKHFEETTTKTMHLFYVWTWPVLNLLGKLLELLSQALLAALIYFKSVTGSYGIGIIILTIIVRAAVWWPTQKANNSMRKMQKIQPLVQQIREKHKDNPQLMNQKVMALYKEHKVNPLGGCLPIFLQMPVFLALYCAFSGAVELRHESFLWCSDLCQPDNIGSILGIQIHPLVLVMTSLMVFQQKLTPSAADPTQQKMMMFMPLVMLLFFYDMPSGLTLYWTVSQIISIIQLLINRHISKREEEKAGATA